ncbi:hypothetical protein ACFFTM_08940 [Pseudoduganella plicata]|uniref:Uncharacterized protein n=1 Tax=Pseudoduganella plicata TaxID=321984 RepID=A0A4P7BDN1_9BURK|nr:hypothetical protein [Pseudoduganella plicata]QBQ35399.1 hypothetical protein E1742_03880 [Pseudoduganella plicata]GGZ01419.1 hypothetical protein GCM10007388_38890 [Pseudoduganella plicata]
MANIELHQRATSDLRAQWQPESTASFSVTHADLLDLFERWEVLADAGSEPRIDVAVRAPL